MPKVVAAGSSRDMSKSAARRNLHSSPPTTLMVGHDSHVAMALSHPCVGRANLAATAHNLKEQANPHQETRLRLPTRATFSPSDNSRSKYPMVWRSPSLRGIVGSQPSFSFAREISGCRCLGSSAFSLWQPPNLYLVSCWLFRSCSP